MFLYKVMTVCIEGSRRCQALLAGVDGLEEQERGWESRLVPPLGLCLCAQTERGSNRDSSLSCSYLQTVHPGPWSRVSCIAPPNMIYVGALESQNLMSCVVLVF